MRRSAWLFATLPIFACGLAPAEEEDPAALAQHAFAEPNIDAGLPGSDTPIASEAGYARDARTPRLDAGTPHFEPPNAPFVVDIFSNGTGCPSGTSASLAPDGETFEVGFSEYVAQVEDGQRISFRDCNLSFRFHGLTPYSYAVSEFRYEGDALLEPNVRAFVTANHYSAGNPVPSADREKRTDLTGPLERAFSFAALVEPIDRIWAPCGLDRNLQVVTRAGLQKQQNKGAGSLRVRTLKIRLVWRLCK